MDKWLKSLTSCGSNKIPPSADQIKAPHQQSIRGKEKYCENKVEQNGEAGIGSNLGISIIPPSSYTNGFGLHRGTQANLAQGEGRLSKNSSNGCLSRRATESVGTPHEALVHMAKVWEDRFHPTDNVQGYVDLGLAENKLCEDILSEKFKRLPDDSEDIGVRYYTDKRGLPCFRESLQVFIEREFQSIHSIDASNIVLGAGLTPVFDTLAFVLTEHGDYIMTTSPYYYMFKKDIAERAGVRLLTVPLNAQPGQAGEEPYSLDVASLEQAYLQAREQGKNVKAFLLVTPNNPLGSVYTATQINDVLHFCAKYALHVIVDEIYALSIHDPETTFVSVLSMPHPDPERTHFLWGFSKDFGLSGYRCGVLWSANKEMIDVINKTMFHSPPAVIQMRLKHIIDDTDWLHHDYFPVLRKRLSQAYVMTRDRLQQLGLVVHPSSCGIFIWVNAARYMPDRSKSAEMWLFQKFVSEKVILVPGDICESREPGYFRLIFSVNPAELKEGLRRIENALRKLRPSQ